MSNSVAFGRVALILLFVLIIAPAVAQTATSPIPLQKHCDDIRDVFKLARFTGEFRRRADAFVAGGCAGAVPLPQKGDAYNIQRWNTSAYILHAGGIELN